MKASRYSLEKKRAKMKKRKNGFNNNNKEK